MSVAHTLKRRLPWWAKIGAKLVLARLPASTNVWRRLSVFRQGAMDDPSYALDVFDLHVGRCRARGLADGFVSLELGPGDTVSSALIAAATGGAHSYLVDVAPYALRDLEPYRRLASELRVRDFDPPDLAEVRTFEELLERCDADYLTGGIRSLRGLPDASVDVVWSHAVLEHVRRHQLDETLRETCRVLRAGGFASHRIDLRDHFAEALNNLRFSDRVWESRAMASSGFYTNRLRSSQLIASFERAGFVVEKVDAQRWPATPTPRRKLAAPFRNLSEEDLRTAELDVLLRAP
jgi:SAM-dependent methyltransferase